MDPAAIQVLHHSLDARRAGSLESVSLPGADLRGAQLIRADLVGADLRGAGLDHAQLAGAKLGRAQLEAALLRWADLAGADLTDADLRGADLSWARLEGVSLAGADLRGATIEGAVGEPATIAGARIDQEMCALSGLDDDVTVRLWRSGAVIDDLEAFDSALIRSACADDVEHLASEAGPPTRRVSAIEAEAKRQRLKQDDEVPPSRRATEESLRLVREVASGGPLSLRSLKLVSPVVTPELLAAPAWKAGDLVMGVTLEAQIGEGNAAAVWRGSSADGEPVAVKLFNTQRAAVGLTLPSFRRGVQVMNRLTSNHETMTAAIRLRCVSLNRLGFVMDLAQNGSATDLPALGWGVKGALGFFEKLCQVVARAHDLGALHRCIKPSNVLLDDDLDPMLADFDMVDLPTMAAEAHQLGGYGPYAAPEELLGQGTQSPTADIFSLGRMLAFLLLGRDPSSRAEEVPRLDELAEHPAGLVRIIRKCTMRAPEARYQWVSDLLIDLDNHEDVEAVGYAGEPGASFLPPRVSSLSHETPWLGAGRKPAERPAPRGRRREPQSAELAPSLFGLPRALEQLIGALGAVLVLATMLSVELASVPPSEATLLRLRIASAFGGAAMTLLSSPIKSYPRMGRLLLLLVAAAVFYLVDLPSLFG